MKTKDRIIQAAITLFNEQGERTVTTNHIAAHLEISPGNLYYHFRNKEDIIHSVFDTYVVHIETSFCPAAEQEIELQKMISYLDAVFYVMWQYRFLYSNLVDILSRDPLLQEKYLVVQQGLSERMVTILGELDELGVVNIPGEDRDELVQSMKLVVTFWISYQMTQSGQREITKPILYKGVLQVLSLMKPYISEDGRTDFLQLSQHYRELALENVVV